MIQSMYEGTTRTIIWAGQHTETFTYERGLRQGCPLSSLLFSLNTANLPSLIARAADGVKFGSTDIFCLAYADDIVLIAQSREKMANQLGALIDGLSRLDLAKNFSKSKIIRFGPGSYMKTEW